MADQPSRATDGDHTTERFLSTPDVLNHRLPADVQEALGAVVGRDSVQTLAEWVRIVRNHTDGDSIAIEDLCHATASTPHRGTVDGETHHFVCFYDAVVLAALVDGEVRIRTQSPGGIVITATAVGREHLHVEPPEAVFAFGVSTDATLVRDAEPTMGDVYAAVCPYVQAFPTKRAYQEWDAEVSAATVAMPLAGATHIAEALVA